MRSDAELWKIVLDRVIYIRVNGICYAIRECEKAGFFSEEEVLRIYSMMDEFKKKMCRNVFTRWWYRMRFGFDDYAFAWWWTPIQCGSEYKQRRIKWIEYMIRKSK